MPNRPRDFTRAQTERLIQKRLGIIRNVWGRLDDWAEGRRHFYNKFNLTCSCRICRASREKYRNKPRAPVPLD